MALKLNCAKWRGNKVNPAAIKATRQAIMQVCLLFLALLKNSIDLVTAKPAKRIKPTIPCPDCSLDFLSKSWGPQPVPVQRVYLVLAVYI